MGEPIDAESLFEDLRVADEPEVHPAPARVSGFRVRLSLRGSEPAVWRRLDLPGDLTLPRMHDAIQAAMGWTDSHLHRFRTGLVHGSPYFVTSFDLDEGEQGVLEDGVRLDQLVSATGDRLWYQYDFGDGWDHVLEVEEVLAARPTTVSCLAGRMACPPEDCGGIGGYGELARWARSGYEDAELPDAFEDAAQARDWLPPDWHPDNFSVEEANDSLRVALAVPVDVTGELRQLLEQLDRRGIRALRQLLGRPASHGSTAVPVDEADRLTETYRILLDVVGDGVALTSAGYLPPELVNQLAVRTGVTTWWIGKANREDLTPAVSGIRDSARALGLVSVRKGRLAPTAAGVRVRQHPPAMLKHLVARLPLGTREFDRHAGWMALAVAGSGVPAEEWREQISELLLDLGWRVDRDPGVRPPAGSPTLVVLEQLAGATRTGRSLRGSDPAVAALARAAIRAEQADPSR